MQSVTCRVCSASVLVRKSSWEQTSVQWTAASLQLCERRREVIESADRAGASPLFLKGCADLRDSIEDAVAHGDVAVLDTQA